MVRLFLPLLVSVKEIKTLEYHNYVEIISGVSYVYEAKNWDKIEVDLAFPKFCTEYT